MASSPTKPAVPPASPPTGEMPDVAMVDIAWQSATKGEEPARIRSSQSTVVSAT